MARKDARHLVFEDANTVCSILKTNFPFEAPEEGAKRELSSAEKVVIKQVSNKLAKTVGDAITAKGVYNLVNPDNRVTTVISGRYVKQATITANEAFLSKAKLAADKRSAKERHVKLKVKGTPGKGKRYRSTTDFVRADRSILGRVKVKPTGKDYLHSIEDFEEREIRLNKAKNKARLTIIGGRALRYGVPALMVTWTINDIIAGKSLTEVAMESVFMADLTPLPKGSDPTGFKAKPIIAYIDYNPFN